MGVFGKAIFTTKKYGLHPATKISRKHIDFNNNRMSVKLAVQVLSRSVHDALIFLKQHPETSEEFKDAEPTAKFCLIFNNAFDILNCRSKFSKKSEFCCPINESTKQILNEKAETLIEYISGLRSETGCFLKHHARKTGIIGLIIDLRNVFNLYNDLQPKGLEYLLSFKLSQDMIETFFSAIRSRGGWNNNPSSKQFESAYKRLLVRNEIQSSVHSNCLEDKIDILYVSSERRQYIEPIGSDYIDQELDFDCNFLNDFITLSLYVEDVVKYISGFIVAKLKIKKIVECSACLSQIISDSNSNASTLTFIKNRGSYILPSNEVIKICLSAEKILKFYESTIFSIPNIMRFLVLKTLNFLNTPFNNAEMDSHILTQIALDNHRSLLSKIIIQYYLKIRLFYLCKQRTEKENTRQKYTRLIIFQGK